MDANFDNAALVYDKTFTQSAIGKIQRAQVYSQLANLLDSTDIKSVLEINCGTGEDALWLASKGLNVIATDISEKMLDVARSKNHSKSVLFEQVDITHLSEQYPQKKFDLIFSNFGGLNCLSPSELKLFFPNAANLLPSRGKLALVIMPKNTLWEKLYLSLKGDVKKAGRRNLQNVGVMVDGQIVPTQYYNPEETIDLARDYFELINLAPIALFTPPSYLEGFFRNKPLSLSVLSKLDYLSCRFGSLSKFSDHYFIEFEKR